jgi:GT2 family glycosyltransferase
VVISDPLVSIIIVTHNNQDDIVDCVDSVLSQGFHSFEVIIVDNASTDKTVDKIQQNFGYNEIVRLIKNPQNDWYTGGNNLGFQHSNGELIVILNPDLVVDKLWLSSLVESYNRHADAGIVGSDVLLYDNPEIVNACGNDIHLTGFVFSRFYREHQCKCMRGEECVAAPSGASFIFSRYKLKEIGREMPFDNTRFVMDCSDADLAIDFLSHGLLCYIAASSKVFHRYKFKMNPMRLFILESGRYQILGHFRMKTLLMMLPALMLTELIVWSFILTKDRRLIKSKIKVQLWLFANFRDTLRSGNSAAKDLNLIKQTIPDMKLYDELGGGDGDGRTFNFVQKALKASNRLFRFIRRFLINSLYVRGKTDSPD